MVSPALHQLLVISSQFDIGSCQPTWPWPWHVLVLVFIKLKTSRNIWHHRQFYVENLDNLIWTSNSKGDKNHEQTKISNHFSSDQSTNVQWGITNPSFWHKGKQHPLKPLIKRLRKRTEDSKPRDRNRTLCKQSNMCWRTISSAVALAIRCGVESASSSQGLKTAYRHHPKPENEHPIRKCNNPQKRWAKDYSSHEMRCTLDRRLPDPVNTPPVHLHHLQSKLRSWKYCAHSKDC